MCKHNLRALAFHEILVHSTHKSVFRIVSMFYIYIYTSDVNLRNDGCSLVSQVRIVYHAKTIFTHCVSAGTRYVTGLLSNSSFFVGFFLALEGCFLCALVPASLPARRERTLLIFELGRKYCIQFATISSATYTVEHVLLDEIIELYSRR